MLPLSDSFHTALSHHLQPWLKDEGITLTEEQLHKIMLYLESLMKWNKAFSLTALKSPKQLVEEFIIESLSLCPYLQGKRFIDLGTGAGVPGLPLAISCPDKHFLLLDSNGKKMRFLQTMVSQLNLKNVSLHHGRIEQYQTDHIIDGVLTKAFATLHKTVSLCSHLNVNAFYALKGPSLYEEEGINTLQFDTQSLNLPHNKSITLTIAYPKNA